jgi:putative ABC transport system permease protein
VTELFGIPTGALATALLIALAAGLGAIAVLALRNRIVVKLALRNVPRRRGRSVLIVVGLMLGTAIIAAALATGDTMSATIRSSVVTSLGQTDELVSARGTDVDSTAIGESTQNSYFAENLYDAVRDAAAMTSDVDGAAPAIFETVAVQDLSTRQNEPRVTLFASDPAALADFEEIRSGGNVVSLADMRPGEVFVNAETRDELETRAGDVVRMLFGGNALRLRVRAVVDVDGAGTTGPALLLPLAVAQEFLGRSGQIEHILVSNRGDEISGAKLSDQVLGQLTPAVRALGLEIAPEKQDGLDLADAEGTAFMTLFTTFGSFSIAAGVLLIFLIFVMLAAERRGELGIARAIGTRRGHLVQMFLFEGVAYDLLAALVGMLLGVGVAYGMVVVMAKALGAFGVDILYDVSPRSLVIGYTLGVMLTFVVVAVSAWRVSVLNIATAVRNLPDPVGSGRGKRRWLGTALGFVLGGLLTAAGISGSQAMPFLLGISMVLVALARTARLLGVRDRVAYTAGGLALVVLWLLPMSVFDRITDFSQNFSVFLVGGLLLVVGATWTIVYNAPLLLGALGWTLGRVRALAPVLRLSVAYPLRSLFRTGVTLAMFTLVVFTLVVGTTVTASFMNVWNDLDAFGGGFEVRAVTAPGSPISSIGHAARRAAGVNGSGIRVAAAQSVMALEARQPGTGRSFESYAVSGLDNAFLSTTTYGFAAMADGYSSAAQVWRALREHTGLAVVDPMVVPRRDHWGFDVLPDFRLSGFYIEDGHFRPIPVDIRDQLTGQTERLTVIGVLADTAPELIWGVSTSQDTLAGLLGARAVPSVYWLDLSEGTDAKATAAALESSFLASGLEAEALQETLNDTVAADKTFNWLIEGFMGLGLVVGVAALGVITARSVVERRQQIGVLRAIGFRRRMIQAAFLIESSFIALTAIFVGGLVGLGVAYNVIADSAQQATWSDLTLQVPWLNFLGIFALVYAVALLTTLAPAVRASRVFPAEALRYQ